MNYYYREINLWVPQIDQADLPALWWDREADKSLLIGVFKHGEFLKEMGGGEYILAFYGCSISPLPPLRPRTE